MAYRIVGGEVLGCDVDGLRAKVYSSSNYVYGGGGCAPPALCGAGPHRQSALEKMVGKGHLSWWVLHLLNAAFFGARVALAPRSAALAFLFVYFPPDRGCRV